MIFLKDGRAAEAMNCLGRAIALYADLADISGADNDEKDKYKEELAASGKTRRTEF